MPLDETKSATPAAHPPPRQWTWWSKRSRLERTLFLALNTTTVIILTLIIITIIQSRKKPLVHTTILKGNQPRPICTSPACVESASRILEKMDPNVDPCLDFYEFACGSYLREGILPHNSVSHNSIDDDVSAKNRLRVKKLLENEISDDDGEAIKKMKMAYNSCLNIYEEEMVGEELRYWLSEQGIGRTPFLAKSWNKTGDLNLENRLAFLGALGISSLLNVTIDSNYYTRLHVYPPEPDFHEYLSPDYDPEYVGAYRELIEKTFNLLNVSQDVDQILEFDRKIVETKAEAMMKYNCSMAEEYKKEEDDDVTFLMPEDLGLMPNFKWALYFEHFSKKIGLERWSDLEVVVHCEPVIRAIFKLVKRTPSRIVADYLSWSFIFQMMEYLGGDFQRLWLSFEAQTIAAGYEYPPRWKTCYAFVNVHFDIGLTALFAEHAFDHQIMHSELQEYLKEIKQAFLQIVEKQEWMDKETRRLSKEKVDAMSAVIAYPHFILDREKVDEEYKPVTIVESPFLSNVITLKLRQSLKSLSENATQSPPGRWEFSPTNVNAYNYQEDNKLILPIAQLIPPSYHPQYPRYLNYGGIGFVIGHEIGHGFDVEGIANDKDGNQTNPWPRPIVAKFRKRVECLVNQFSNYTIDGTQVDGNTTINDNIADLTGVAQAYLAFLRHEAAKGPEEGLPGLNYTNNQLFFLRYGQSWCTLFSDAELAFSDDHSPGKFRVNGPLENLQSFSETFNCPQGSPMNPSKKCQLWV